MHEHQYPDPQIADLLELLNAADGLQEIEELLKQARSPAANNPIPYDGNRYAAKVASVMSKTRARP
jgi:hypothetical protein